MKLQILIEFLTEIYLDHQVTEKNMKNQTSLRLLLHLIGSIMFFAQQMCKRAIQFLLTRWDLGWWGHTRPHFCESSRHSNHIRAWLRDFLGPAHKNHDVQEAFWDYQVRAKLNWRRFPFGNYYWRAVWRIGKKLETKMYIKILNNF